MRERDKARERKSVKLGFNGRSENRYTGGASSTNRTGLSHQINDRVVSFMFFNFPKGCSTGKLMSLFKVLGQVVDILTIWVRQIFKHPRCGGK